MTKFFSAVCVFILVSAASAEDREVAKLRKHIRKIEDLCVKISEPLHDPHAKAAFKIIEKSPSAALPLLLEDKETRFVDFFPHRICDMAHYLLCKRYEQHFYFFVIRKPDDKLPWFGRYLNATDTLPERQRVAKKWSKVFATRISKAHSAAESR